MTQEEMKALLEEAWKEVFQVDSVSDDSDFFEAGGDSIMAVQISAWLIQKGVKLDLADVFMTPVFGKLAEKLTETDPLYIPEAMLTKEIAAKEMGFASVAEAEAAERRNLGLGDQQICTPEGNKQAYAPAGDQQVCTPAGDQQVCTPAGDQQVCTPAGDQQVCTPAGDQQVCTPAGDQQICTPAGDQQVCTPAGDQQICTPAGDQQVCTPAGDQQVCTPAANQQVCTPAGNQQVCTPAGGQQICTPAGGQQVCTPAGDQQVCTPAPMAGPVPPMAGPMPMAPPQIQKYLSHGVDKPIENPNVIKIEKAKLGEKVKEPDVALMDVMKGLLPDFDKTEDFFAQGLTSLDTVKMVTRCGEAGYEIELKDIYMHSNFDDLVKCMK